MNNFSETLTTDQPVRPQRLIVAIALFLLTTGGIILNLYGWKQSVLFLIGGLLGITLYHARFGFASAYRRLIVERDVTSIYAQLLMLAIATLLFAPILASGTVWGQNVRGAIAPIGLSGAIGAFLFGIGMQLGGACGCGTLYTIGGGSLNMIITLITFSIGAFFASLTRQFWAGLPSIEPIVLGNNFGWTVAVVLQWIIFILLAVLLYWWSKGNISPSEIFLTKQEKPSLVSILRGPWSVGMGAILLAILNCFTLILSGQPWRITWGFALWTAQIAKQFGWDSTSSPFWASESAQAILSKSILADVSSVMNIGLVLGALLAAGLAGKWIPKNQLKSPLIIINLLGGLIMGYGAFLAAGCNVSAFFGGIASTSIHGWVWIIFALIGTWFGVHCRLFLQNAINTPPHA